MHTQMAIEIELPRLARTSLRPSDSYTPERAPTYAGPTPEQVLAANLALVGKGHVLGNIRRRAAVLAEVHNAA